jgi:hypothetical protein
MAQAVSRQLLTAESQVPAGVKPCGMYGGQSDAGVSFSLTSLVFPCQYYSSVALHAQISS